MKVENAKKNKIKEKKMSNEVGLSLPTQSFI